MTPSLAQRQLNFFEHRAHCFLPTNFLLHIDMVPQNAHFILLLFFSLPVCILQSVRRHSALVLTVTINGMQEIHPEIHLLLLIL